MKNWKNDHRRWVTNTYVTCCNTSVVSVSGAQCDRCLGSVRKLYQGLSYLPTYLPTHPPTHPPTYLPNYPPTHPPTYTPSLCVRDWIVRVTRHNHRCSCFCRPYSSRQSMYLPQESFIYSLHACCTFSSVRCSFCYSRISRKFAAEGTTPVTDPSASVAVVTTLSGSPCIARRRVQCVCIVYRVYVIIYKHKHCTCVGTVSALRAECRLTGC